MLFRHRYFETLSIPLVRGRTFSDQEMKDQTPVALINEALARHCWPGEQPIGKRFKGGSTAAYYQVIGVVKDVRSIRLSQVDGPYFYEPIKLTDQLGLKLLVRTESNPHALVNPLREAVREIDPHILVSPASLEEVWDDKSQSPAQAPYLPGQWGCWPCCWPPSGCMA